MKKILKLFTISTIQIYRDQMLLILCFAPFLAGAGIRLLVPVAGYWLEQLFSFHMSNYYLLADTVTICMGPMMIGVMTGLLMLDERDEGIITYFSVTPFGGGIYLVSRLAIPFFYAVLASMLTMSYATLSSVKLPLFIAPVIASSTNGIIMTMIMIIAASNKVEGLAVSKLLGLLLLGIPFAWFGTPFIKTAGAVLPSFWMTQMLAAAADMNIESYFLNFLICLICISLWAAGLLKLFKRRTA